jgi:hypothetical protein
MSDGTAFYSIALNAEGVTTFSFFQLAISSGVITNGGTSYVNPTNAQSTYSNFYATAISAQGSPAGVVTIGAAIKSSDPVTGSVMVSPPTNVATVVTLYGLGTTLGTYTLQAGQSSGNFSFHVNSADAIPQSDVEASLRKILPEYGEKK